MQIPFPQIHEMGDCSNCISGRLVWQSVCVPSLRWFQTAHKNASDVHHYTYTVLKISNGEILSINRSGNLKQDSFSLFSYDWLDAFYPVSTSDQEADTELDTLLKMCSCFGVEQETILELLDFGYSYDEVETFLMSPSLLQEELKNIAAF